MFFIFTHKTTKSKQKTSVISGLSALSIAGQDVILPRTQVYQE